MKQPNLIQDCHVSLPLATQSNEFSSDYTKFKKKIFLLKFKDIVTNAINDGIKPYLLPIPNDNITPN